MGRGRGSALRVSGGAMRPPTLDGLRDWGPRLVMMVAVPGSGKTTVVDGVWGRDPRWAVVSLDRLRAVAPGSTGEADQGATGWAVAAGRSMAARAATDGRGIVIDATNVQGRVRREWEAWAAERSLPVGYVVLDVPFDVAAARNRRRERVVPEAPMERMRQRFAATTAVLADGPHAVVRLDEASVERLLGPHHP